MTAFLELLNTYAIFFYIAGVIAVLFGIKMLFDARRSARTTLFTLEQEQASDRAFRALLVMLGATVFIGAVAGINAFVAPAVPPPETEVQPTAISFTPPVYLPSPTPKPTLTEPPPTEAPGGPTEPAGPTKPAGPTEPAGPTVPPPPTAAGATATRAVPPPTVTPEPTTTVEPPTPVPPPTSAAVYPVFALNTPPNGDSIGSNRIRFSWGFNPASEQLDVPEILPQDQFYRVVIAFTDKTKNDTSTLVLCTHENSADSRTGITVTDYRTQAVDNVFRWNVTAVQAASQAACEAGEFSPLSPTSATSTFLLP